MAMYITISQFKPGLLNVTRTSGEAMAGNKTTKFLWLHPEFFVHHYTSGFVALTAMFWKGCTILGILFLLWGAKSRTPLLKILIPNEEEEKELFLCVDTIH